MALTKEQRKELLKKQFSENKSGFGGAWYLKSEDELKALGLGGLYKAKDGENFLAMLPQADGPFSTTVWVHYDIGPNGDSFLCPRKMANQPCPICEYADSLTRQGLDKDAIKPFWPARRFLFMVADMDDAKSLARGILVYDAPWTIMEGIEGLCTVPRTKEIIDISDPDEHRNVVFVKTGQKLLTKYSGFATEDRRSPLPPHFFNTIPFSEVLKYPDLERMRQDIFAVEPDASVTDEVIPPDPSAGRGSFYPGGEVAQAPVGHTPPPLAALSPRSAASGFAVQPAPAAVPSVRGGEGASPQPWAMGASQTPGVVGSGEAGGFAGAADNVRGAVAGARVRTRPAPAPQSFTGFPDEGEGDIPF